MYIKRWDLIYPVSINFFSFWLKALIALVLTKDNQIHVFCETFSNEMINLIKPLA